MKNLVILGSTGSIGRSCLDVVRANPGRYRISALGAGSNHELLLAQAREFKPEIVALSDAEAASKLRKSLSTEVLEGAEGMKEIASLPDADFVLSAIVGFAGLEPTLAAVRAGKTIGLANKEALVVAGELVNREAAIHDAKILPVDSEHSAIFQCLHGHDMEEVRKVTITASGGPFFGRKKEDLKKVTINDALNHPSWSMGRKITIDSATLMNKGFEVIEAHHLFGLRLEKIGVLVHPQSIVHCLVEFRDGSVVSHMSVPDMKAPIAFALSYPDRLENVIKPLELQKIGTLTFHEPDIDAFPCLSYAYSAMREGGTMPAVLNAANEAAVEAFLSGSIGFAEIPVIIEETMNSIAKKEIRGLEDIIAADSDAKDRAGALVEKLRITTGAVRR